MSTPEIDLCMRYDKQNHRYEFRAAEGQPIVQFTEVKAAELLQSLKDKEAQHTVMKFLFEQAKKDPKGNWVEASSAAVTPGQGHV